MGTGKLFHRAIHGSAREWALPLARILEVELGRGPLITRTDSDALWSELSYYGSNDIAYWARGGNGVDYPEIVRDVCDRLDLTAWQGDTVRDVVHNETSILSKLFADAWDRLTEAEQRELLEGADFPDRNTFKSGAAAAAAVFGMKATGFGAYKMAVVIANSVSRALIGRGLAFGANATLTRTLGVALGPVGLALTAAPLFKSAADPALRKTLPAVTIVAAIRRSRN